MYQTKTFRAKPIEDIKEELDQIANAEGAPYVRNVFLADGDAMTLPVPQLEIILELIRSYFPRVRRISSYCLPRNIRHTFIENLTKLRENGLSLVYIGCESGDDQVLRAVQKGETFETSLEALTKLKKSGIKRSVMILLGLGGKELFDSHARESARLCSKSEPEFLSVLTTSFPKGMQRVVEGYQKEVSPGDEYTPLRSIECLQELELFLSTLNIHQNQTVFRSDHASNYYVLKGRLGRDKQKLLEELRLIIRSPQEDDKYNLRPE
mmetsp:Transcript_32253/g.49031  ORF Transcript_32253/g.49031 Transcript_32253/m.49031 type:complete len:266 (-) Transcript_32253:990-1787(-)